VSFSRAISEKQLYAAFIIDTNQYINIAVLVKVSGLNTPIIRFLYGPYPTAVSNISGLLNSAKPNAGSDVQVSILIKVTDLEVMQMVIEGTNGCRSDPPSRPR
jgi:hypothetical protein